MLKALELHSFLDTRNLIILINIYKSLNRENVTWKRNAENVTLRWLINLRLQQLLQI